MDTAELFSAIEGRPLAYAARLFADKDVPVFPCVPGGKRPLVEHGFHEATTDPGRVEAWWRRWPSANIAIPTGAVSGLEVIDVDVKPAGSGFTGFNRALQEGFTDGWVALVRSPSGGMHAYYPADPVRPHASWQAARAHVDFRGDRGYIIAPPSAAETPSHGRAVYALIGGPRSAPEPIDAARLRDFLDPRPEISSARGRGAAGVGDAERLARWVAGRGEGERNRGLFWASCRLAETGMSVPEMNDVLGPAAEQVGLSPREVAVTIRSAYRATRPAPAPASGGSRHDEIPRRMSRAASQVLS
jgi:hypothetical protein